MVKMRKKLLVSLMAAMLAFGAVACEDDAGDDDTGDTTDPVEDMDS